MIYIFVYFQDSLLDSVSPCDSLPKLNPGNYENPAFQIPQDTYVLPELFIKPQPQPTESITKATLEIPEPSETIIDQDPTQNYARDYDDVDDVLLQPQDAETNTGKTDTAVENEITDATPTATNSLSQSRKKVSQMVKNVNDIIKKGCKQNQYPVVEMGFKN